MGLTGLSYSASPAQIDPHLQPDNTLLSLQGTAQKVTDNDLMLDFGDGMIRVETDRLESESSNISDGDKIIVYGEVDDDLFESTALEANVLYIKNSNITLTRSGMSPNVSASQYNDDDMSLTGTITNINGDKFTIDNDKRSVTVDTSELGYNPFDDEGSQKLNKGDRVTVTGDADDDTWKNRTLNAETITSMTKADSKMMSSDKVQNSHKNWKSDEKMNKNSETRNATNSTSA